MSLVEEFAELLKETSQVLDLEPAGLSSDGDNYHRHFYRKDLGENFISYVAVHVVLVRPAVHKEKCAVEVLACVSARNRGLGAISNSCWATVITEIELSKNKQALGVNLAKAIQKAWQGLPELARQLPEGP